MAFKGGIVVDVPGVVRRVDDGTVVVPEVVPVDDEPVVPPVEPAVVDGLIVTDVVPVGLGGLVGLVVLDTTIYNHQFI